MLLKLRDFGPSRNTPTPARADAAVQAASCLIEAGRAAEVVDFLLDVAADPTPAAADPSPFALLDAYVDRPGLTELFQRLDHADLADEPLATVRTRTRHLRAQSSDTSNKRATWNNRRIRIAVPTAQVPETGVLA